MGIKGERVCQSLVIDLPPFVPLLSLQTKERKDAIETATATVTQTHENT